MRKVESVDHLEYRGGYSLVEESDLLAIIAAYREGKAKKDTLRIFAGEIEKQAIHEKSKVDLRRIVNCKAALKGIKRLRQGEMKRAGETLALIKENRPKGKARLKAVSRVGLRAIAQGRLSCSEAIVFLMYSAKRISQRKPLRRLLDKERYARFTYGDLSELSGIPKANICRAVAALKREGLISTVWVVRQNVNHFGLLFVDGPLLSLIPGAVTAREKPERHKTTTPPAKINNAPVIELPTLKKSYPKSVTEKNKTVLVEAGEKREELFSCEWYRILERAKAMKENQLDQVA